MANKSALGGTKNAAQTREERLKAALKANLARRKAQTRARNEADNNTGTTEAGQDKEN